MLTKSQPTKPPPDSETSEVAQELNEFQREQAKAIHQLPELWYSLVLMSVVTICCLLFLEFSFLEINIAIFSILIGIFWILPLLWLTGSLRTQVNASAQASPKSEQIKAFIKQFPRRRTIQQVDQHISKQKKLIQKRQAKVQRTQQTQTQHAQAQQTQTQHADEYRPPERTFVASVWCWSHLMTFFQVLLVGLFAAWMVHRFMYYGNIWPSAIQGGISLFAGVWLLLCCSFLQASKNLAVSFLKNHQNHRIFLQPLVSAVSQWGNASWLFGMFGLGFLWWLGSDTSHDLNVMRELSGPLWGMSWGDFSWKNFIKTQILTKDVTDVIPLLGGWMLWETGLLSTLRIAQVTANYLDIGTVPNQS